MAGQNVMEEVSVEQLINAHSLIVPEIQREYVWGNNDYEILDKFFTDIKDGIRKSPTNSNNQEEQAMLKKMLEFADESKKDYVKGLIAKAQSVKDLNIGFLYSYKPPYYRAYERSEDVYLIDGQQRFTTLFLLLFYFSLKENKYGDFKKLFRFDQKLEKLAFDYRVRSLTHNFLIDLISNCNKIDDIRKINKKTWYLTEFAKDVTINAIVGTEKSHNKAAIVGTLKKIEEYFANDEVEYYEFIKKQIKFWHFKTEETSQGEELYITMNSRGQQLADNENTRARLFEDEEVQDNQIFWGKEWEEWQDFFWKNKEKNGNADLGFNQFLKWVSIIECFKNEKFKSVAEGEKRYKEIQKNSEISDSIKLPVIKKYFDALKKIKDKHDAGYFNSSWFKENFNAEWLKKAIDQKHLIKLLPAIIYISYEKPESDLNRFVRFFSNATKENLVQRNPDTYIIQSIYLAFDFCKSNFTDIVDIVNYKSTYTQFITPEDEFKFSLYRTPPANTDRQSLESAFWTAEDYPYCDGKIESLLQASCHVGSFQNFVLQSKIGFTEIPNFSLSKFKNIFSSFCELTGNSNEIWGEFLNTEIYSETWNRIVEKTWIQWYLNVDFLKLVLERTNRSNETLSDFTQNNEKRFIKGYNGNKYLIQNEVSAKKQVYLYYILHSRILNRWNGYWNSKKNFGVYNLSDLENSWNYFSMFTNDKIYQLYDRQWRYNSYDSRYGISIQHNVNRSQDYIQELINWANI
jgi:hypothetical protein